MSGTPAEFKALASWLRLAAHRAVSMYCSLFTSGICFGSRFPKNKFLRKVPLLIFPRRLSRLTSSSALKRTDTQCVLSPTENTPIKRFLNRILPRHLVQVLVLVPPLILGTDRRESPSPPQGQVPRSEAERLTCSLPLLLCISGEVVKNKKREKDFLGFLGFGTGGQIHYQH